MNTNIQDNTSGANERSLYQASIPNYSDLSDEKLVRLFVEKKDEEAFNEIVNRYADKTFRLALRIIRNTHDAEEVLQEVFLSMEKLNTFREESKFSTWLYRVTANACYMRLRANKRKHENEVSLEDYIPYDKTGVINGIQIRDWSNRPDELLLSREGMDLIEKSVNELPIPYRLVFHLRDVEGLTNQEVAKVLGLTVSAVKSRILRARLFFSDKLSDYFYEWRK